jgi:hypothetical protein
MKQFICAVAVAMTALAGLAQTGDKAVELKDEPHHRLLIENDYVRVWAFGVKGHEATLMHNHGLPYFGVALGDAEFVNTLEGKPEAHGKASDGQINYSRGGFAHTVQAETDAPFRNFTIELLKQQGAGRNRCVKVIANGDVDCPTGGDTPLRAATSLAFETDEVEARTGDTSSTLKIAGDDAKQNHLLAVLEKSDVTVETPGQAAKKLHAGEAIWLPAGTSYTVTRAGGAGGGRVFLLIFKENAVGK